MRNLLALVVSIVLVTVAYSQENKKVVPDKVVPDKVVPDKVVPDKIEVQKVNPKVNSDIDLRVEPRRRDRTVEPQRRTVEQRIPTFYNNYLRRQARPDEVQIWERKNLSPLRIQSGILGSDEYFHRFHDNRREFIVGLFLDVYGRYPTEEEIAAWSVVSDSREEIAYQLLIRQNYNDPQYQYNSVPQYEFDYNVPQYSNQYQDYRYYSAPYYRYYSAPYYSYSTPYYSYSTPYSYTIQPRRFHRWRR